jgi:hypothetical protein
MVTALDPELSRLVSRYTAPGNPADGAGSLQWCVLELAHSGTPDASETAAA